MGRTTWRSPVSATSTAGWSRLALGGIHIYRVTDDGKADEVAAASPPTREGTVTPLSTVSFTHGELIAVAGDGHKRRAPRRQLVAVAAKVVRLNVASERRVTRFCDEHRHKEDNGFCSSVSEQYHPEATKCIHTRSWLGRH